MTAALADVLGGAADDVMRTSSELPEFPDVIHPGGTADLPEPGRGDARLRRPRGTISGRDDGGMLIDLGHVQSL